jgi:DNA polymerase III subunit delta
VSSEQLQAVYLLSGSDRPKVRRALARLRARFPAESVELLSADSANGEDAVAACNSLGLFEDGGGHLVIVEGVERWRADDVDAVVGYLGDAVVGTVLALLADAPVKARALVDACARAGQILTYEVPKPRDPSGWVRQEFERLGVSPDGDAARALVEIVGDDVTALATEVEKLVVWAGDEPIGRREVERLAAPTSETFVWVLTDAWGNRDVAGVLHACESLFDRRTKEPFVIASALGSYIGRVRAAQTLAREGLRSAEVAKRLRMKEYPARKAVGHAKNYAREELDAAVVRLAGLDAALKGASRLAAELELELALLDVTRARDPAEV